ncbi:hypothetical protein [Burkholderia gladioli]|uniref:hypothetical protein n=1 Tax=Burkholderia gladioli TaxID=28095 RepID=UPI00163DFEC4|nr:hypothetical protein [Burkholderia gladioli]
MKLMVEVMEANFSMHCFLYWRIIQTKILEARGAIVHTAERYFGKGYEQKLIESLSRNPTVHTVWMLNRVINGVDGDLKVFFIDLMRRISSDNSIGADVRGAAKEFLS